MTDEIPRDARNRLEADIAAFQAAIISADVEFVGKDPDYRPSSPRLRRQIENRK